MMMMKRTRRRWFLLLAPLLFVPLMLWSLADLGYDELLHKEREAAEDGVVSQDAQVPWPPSSALPAATSAAVSPAQPSTVAKAASTEEGVGDSPDNGDEDVRRWLDANTGSIRGRVLDPDGRPVAGAVARVTVGCNVRSATTDSRGEFLLSEVMVTWHQVQAFPPPGSDLLDGSTRTRVPFAKAQPCVEVRLRRAARLAITVDRPLPANISIEQRAGEYSCSLRLGASWDEGASDLSPSTTGEALVAPGTYDVTLWGDEGLRFAHATVAVPLEGAQVQLAVQQAVRLSGQVRDASGRPVPAAIYVRSAVRSPDDDLLMDFGDEEEELDTGIEDAAFLTDEAGAFGVEALPLGDLELLAVPLDAAYARVEKALVVRAGQAPTVELTAPPAVEVRVTADRSLDGAMVYAFGPPGLDVQADGKSALRVRGLRPGDRALVLAQSSEFLLLDEQEWAGLTQVSGDGRDAHLRTGPLAQLELYARDASGAPAGSGLEWRVRRESKEGMPWRAALDVLIEGYEDDPPEAAQRGFLIPFADPGGFVGEHPLDRTVLTGGDSSTGGMVLAPGRWTVEGPDGTRTVTLAPQERRTLTIRTR